ncbi:MAG TPA: hypothetical protein VIL86_07720 [Tepidisphaeraceae bacterium]
MSDKIVINLPTPLPQAMNCLPHAAMNLGAPRGVGLSPSPGMVSRLVIEERMGAWCFYRLDQDGGYVEDSWHPTREDALFQARKEFGVEVAGMEARMMRSDE